MITQQRLILTLKRRDFILHKVIRNFYTKRRRERSWLVSNWRVILVCGLESIHLRIYHPWTCFLVVNDNVSDSNLSLTKNMELYVFTFLSSQFFMVFINFLFWFPNAVLHQLDSSATWEDHVADEGPLQKVCNCFVALIALSYNTV